MPERVLWTLRSRYLIAPIHYEGLQRVEPLEIPEDALREMICNAIVHKNYHGPYIQMRVWDDRVELWNYGDLPNDFTIERLLQTHESYPRNPLIAQVFYLAGLIENWGRGYEKIHDAFIREQLMQPTFEQVRGGILVTIKREKFIAIQTGKPIGSEVSAAQDNQTTQKSSPKSSPKSSLKTRDVIVELMRTNPIVTIAEIATIIHTSERNVKKHTRNLQNEGIIRRIDGNKGGHWEIVS